MIGAPTISLKAAVSSGLWKALNDHAERTGQPVSHIINSALADYLGVSRHTLYQVSTATALVEGVYEGAVRIGTLREHGNFGLGTFENLEGEMVTVDGHFFQVRADGSVQACEDSVLTPFAVVTHFAPDETVILEHCPDMGAITSRFDGLRRSENLFFALRVDGVFDFVHTRAMRKTTEGVPLVEAAAVQPEFEFHNVSGTLVGFWTPEYAKTFNVPGYHFHFISDDRKSGGHLLQCSGNRVRLQIQRQGDYRVALPGTEDFLKADLRRDPTVDLATSEGERK
jgi:acetolactate decarboxylase